MPSAKDSYMIGALVVVLIVFSLDVYVCSTNSRTNSLSRWTSTTTIFGAISKTVEYLNVHGTKVPIDVLEGLRCAEGQFAIWLYSTMHHTFG